MSLSSPFIHRPIGTTLLTIAIALAGALAYFLLPVSPLPQVDYPTISVSASLPGANPETMAKAVATPLERQFGRIAGVNEMTSTSTRGSTGITLQFDLSRNIDAAARDVQACINAAAGNLPSYLPSKPSYRKVNPADAPILILAITSDIYEKARMYDAASSILAQKLAQVEGVGQVFVGGGALPAVRVEVNPTALNNLGLGLEDVRATLANANTNHPKGQVSNHNEAWDLDTTDQLFTAAQYRNLIIDFHNGSPVRVGDVATTVDSVEDVHTDGLADGKPAVLLVIFRQPGANIIATVDRVRALEPQLQATIPPAMKISEVMDRTATIRGSVHDVEITLMISIGLVILVVFIFLRDVRSTLIPSVVVPVSLVSTFAVMYLCGYSIDNLSLMAMTIATGFVVDDAIVVIENITRYLEHGMKPLEAALKGVAEIGFTVMSISISLVAVFIPILLMGGYIGRMFREFAVTLSVAIGISMAVSLTTTPMMCAVLLHSRRGEKHNWLYQMSEHGFNYILRGYEWALGTVLRHSFITLLVAIGTAGLSVWLYLIAPWGLFPQQDTGRLSGQIVADQDTSSQAMKILLRQFVKTTSSDPAVQGVVAFAGGRGTTNQASMFVTLKPIQVRKLSADKVIGRLNGKLLRIPGAILYLQAVQDLKAGGRSSNLQYQYALQGDSVDELTTWAPKLLEKIQKLPGIAQVTSDQQNKGLETKLTIDRATAARLGLTPQNIDDILYDAFGQRQVSTMYTALNQYHVVMEVDPQYAQDPNSLQYVYVNAADGSQIPLSAFTHYAASNTPLAVNHQGVFPAITLSFNLAPGMALGTVITEIHQAEAEMHLPATIHGSFAGTAQLSEDAKSGQPILICAAIGAVYIVLGMLYESFIHPITILSTIPSAGVGALLALRLFHLDLTVIALIGIILLIGIVKKNAIMMIDFALDAERREGKSPYDAIFEACILRFRPITMTTMAAMLGGLPLAIGLGVGSEIRRPLGVAIVGGLLFSQALTLFTTPVVYLYMDRFRLWIRGPGHAKPGAFEVETVPA